MFYENIQRKPVGTDLQERSKKLILDESIELEDESNDERPSHVPSNNKITLKHDEEFLVRNS